MKMSDYEISISMEDDSDSWQAQRQLEERRRFEEERPTPEQLGQRLERAIRMLDVIEPRLQQHRQELIELLSDIRKKT
tara:strand:- start:98 stop:331 length:234 start_codon:yes stop_codon:yes gene_type:complete